MEEIMTKKSKHIIRNLILILIFLLLLGIRGYENWQVYEYLLYVALPIGYLSYDLIKARKRT